MTLKEVRLGWDESQVHYLAMSEIEDKAWCGINPNGKVSNGKRKKIEAKIHNETNSYLRTSELVYRNGGFYKTVLVSDD